MRVACLNPNSKNLSTELLNIRLLTQQRKRHNTTDVQLRSVDMHIQSELLTGRLDVLQSLLVVGTSTTDPDLNLVFVQNGGDVTESANDTLESRGDVGEVSDTTTDEEDLAVGVGGGAEHQVKDCAGVVVGLGFGGSTRVLAVVGEFADEASGGDSVGVDDGGTTTSDEGPDTTVGVEDGKFERGTGLSVHVGDELLLLAHFTTEGSREFHGRTGVNGDLAVGLGSGGQAESAGAAGNGPFGTALELSGLVELGSQIKEVNLGGGGISVGDDDQRVDFKVGELAVDVDSIETGDEVNQHIVDALGDVLQQSGGDLFVGGVVLQVNRDKKLLSFGVNVTDVDTTLVGEEDPVTLFVVSVIHPIDSRNKLTSRTELMLM